MAVQRLRYEPRLDGLRAIAVLLVIVSHTTSLRGAGPIGVGTFFVLSGFLITSILDQERDDTGELHYRNFYARRALRLFPALVATVAIAVIAVALGAGQSSIGHMLGGAAMALTYTTDVFTLVAHGRWVAPELLHTWSLAVEEQFYLLWPITYLFVMRRYPAWRTRWTIFGAGIAIAIAVRAIASTQAAIALSPLTWTDALLIGCCLALAYRNGWIKPTKINSLLLLVAAAPAIWITINQPTRFDQVLGFTLFDIGVAVWIVNCLGRPSKLDVLGHPLMVRIGKLSYAAYLIHGLLLELIGDSFHKGNAAHIAGLLIATYVLSELSYRFVEQPFLRRKERFAVPS